MTTRHLAVALTALAVIATACSPSDAPPAGSTSSTTSSSAAVSTTTPSSSSAPATPTACDELGGSVADDTCTVHDETPKYTIDIVFPADYPDQQTVVDLMKSQRDGFVDLINERPDRENPYALDIKGKEYRSGSPETGTVSVAFTEYSEFGGAHPETNYDAVNYDLAKRAPITFDTLFKPGSDPVAVLDPIVKGLLSQKLDGYPVDDNASGAQVYQSFALTDDAVIFFIGQGAWTIEAAGPQEISVPRSDLAAILA